MIDSSNYLPQYALNQLADRVAMKVDYISRLYKADKVWDNTIELCQRIEAEPRDVSTVIIEVKKDTGTAVSGTNIRWYHVRLTLIYILLYYRHNDIDAYKKKVFPQLVKNMGAYADDKILNTKIQQEIANIKEEDKLLEQESTKLHNIPTVPSASDISEGRKTFIQASNAGVVEINAINWADATIGFDRAVMKELFWGVEDDELKLYSTPYKSRFSEEDVLCNYMELVNLYSQFENADIAIKFNYLSRLLDEGMYGGRVPMKITYEGVLDLVKYFKAYYEKLEKRNRKDKVLMEKIKDTVNGALDFLKKRLDFDKIE
jgi:hypothetical protein